MTTAAQGHPTNYEAARPNADAIDERENELTNEERQTTMDGATDRAAAGDEVRLLLYGAYHHTYVKISHCCCDPC